MSTIAIGKDVQQCYDSIVAGDPSVTWGVFNYEGQTELKLQASGADDLTEFPDEFSDGKLQYAFLRIKEPNSKLPKMVLIGWCGDGAPRKGVFQQHFSGVAAKLTGYHVQITARSEEDVSEMSILKKVEDASGAKYSMSNSSSVFGPTTSKKPTTNSLVNQLKGQSTSSYNPRKPALTEPRLPPSASVKPSAVRTSSYASRKTETWDTPKTDVHGKIKQDEPKPRSPERHDEPVKSSYQPIGRPDINALRAQAQDESSTSASGAAGTTYKPVEVPNTGSLADRMSAFTGNNNKSATSTPSPRKASNPLASRFGGTIGGTKPAIPSSGPRESKAMGGLAKNFGSEDGKTPAQLWAERKARERGESIPEPVKEAPVKATVYDADGPNEEREEVSSIRDRFSATSINEPTVPPAATSRPTPVMPIRAPTPEPEDQEPEEEEDAFEQPPPPPAQTSMPPPPNMGARPAAVISVPPPAPVHEDEPEEVEEQHVERSPSPEPVKNSFKAQLEQKLGGVGAASVPVMNAPAAAHDQAGQSGDTSARAIYEYEAQEENEITLAEGELVTEIEMIDEGWWSGKNESGHTGLFPSNYVELVEEAAQGAHTSTLEPPIAEPVHAAPKSHGSGLCATALYEYEAAEEGEIGFAEGETIQEIQQIDDGWWQGKNLRGEEGLFPSNYVELID